MKTTTLLIILAMLLTPLYGKPAKDFLAGAEIPGLKYISDSAAFHSEDSDKLNPSKKRALLFAKKVLALYLDAEIMGTFSIAEADWGFQVNCTKIETKKNGQWTPAVEGFGEVFLSKNFSRIQIDYGP